MTESSPPDDKPTGHIDVLPEKTGVLLTNLGTPDATDYWSVRRYLSEFLSDQRVIDQPQWRWQPLLQLIILSKRPFTSGAAYRSIWNTQANESPLLTITRAQTEKLAATLQQTFGDGVVVDFCMRYGNPSIRSRVQAMIDRGCRKILFFPLYPQYAGATTATANDQFFRLMMQQTWQPAIRTVPAYFDQPVYIDALAQSVERAYAGLASTPDLLVTSYHGMPKRYLDNGDPYHCQCQKTTRLLRDRLGWSRDAIATTFQSKFGPGDWLLPATVDEVARLAKKGIKHLAVIAPAFSADCIETLEEINHEIRESFIAAGGEVFTYIPCLNDDDAHINALAKIVGDNLAGWQVDRPK
ncbi:MAG: ferrochelatase [Paracoccaceae bacterium]